MSDQKEAKNLVDPSALAIVSSGSVTKQHTEDFETIVNNAGAGASTDEIYDRFGKLVYLFDDSNSMDQHMSNSISPDMYEWDAELLAKFRKAMENYLSQIEKKAASDDGDDRFGDDEDEEEPLFNEIPVSDEELKRLICALGLDDEFKIKLEPSSTFYRPKSGTKSKIQAVKEAARGFVEKRFAKYPEANVLVFSFDQDCRALSRAANKDAVMNGVNQLQAQGGNTRIVPAVATVIGEFKRRPSPVSAHHMVLVTDGYDNADGLMTDLLPQLKELGIVFDFIFVKGTSCFEDDYRYKNKIDAIKQVCEATGGEYTEVKTVDDFEQKFLAYSNRPLLPAARS